MQADCTAAEQKTTVYPSSKPDQVDFASLWERFVQYAQSMIPNFTVDATNRPVLEALLAYFARDEAMCQKLGIKLHKGLLLLGPVWLWQNFYHAAFRAWAFPACSHPGYC